MRPSDIFRVSQASPQVEVRPIKVQPAHLLEPPLIASNLDQRMGCQLVGSLSQARKL